MVKTRFNLIVLIGLWSLLCFTLCMFLFDTLAILSILGLNFIKLDTQTALFVVIFYSPLVFLSLKWLLFYNNVYLIDTANKTVKITNYFTRNTILYNLNYFDGYIDSIVKSNLGTYLVLYLVKDKKFIHKISGKVFCNVEEAKVSLADLKYLGPQKLTFRSQIKILFKKPVLE